ncbi:hypothetical protein [Brachybacterium sacelli]|uniref:DUF222 domain-containing protein n=1 Tax=Brachybacterium sacelli TaxID=173364 RepID=A0ABS4X6G1_9MICO|nr:hypothetical protein [Brachybacterium sacelli]MBP2383843.1 hypothetical protein [Brachybacterium sacelli]
MDLSIRADVLDAITQELHSTESLVEVVEDIAYWEASARKRFSGSDTSADEAVDCAMTGPLVTVTLHLADAPARMLRESLRAGETIDGVVTALLIAEVRHRRTELHWPVVSAGEPVMTDDAAIIHALMRGHDTTITATSGGLMHTITADVRVDVLDAFDAALDDWEDRSEVIAALIHLEDEVRDAGARLVSGDSAPMAGPWATTIDLPLDEHDHAALARLLRDGAEAGSLLTALMLRALTGAHHGVTRADDPLLIPA